MTISKAFRLSGIQKKIIAIVIIGVGLSIGISTLINIYFLTNSLSKNAGEKILLISEKTRDTILGKIDDEIKLIKIIAIAPLTQIEINEANQIFASIPESILDERVGQINRDWMNESASTEALKKSIEETSLSRYLKDVQAGDPGEVELIITDVKGFNVAMSNRTTDYWQGDEDWWKIAASGQTYISPPVYDLSSHYWALNIAVPIYQSEKPNDFIGVIRGTMDITSMLNEIFEINFGASGRGVFISSNKILYTREGKSLNIQDLPEAFQQELKAHQNNWVKDFTFIDGSQSVAAMHDITYEGQTIGWILVVMDQSELREIVLSTIQENFIIAVLLILILGGAGSLTANQILKVLQTLKDEVHRLAEGNYSLSFSKPLVSSTDPDIQSLVESFLTMRTAVQNREKTLKANEKKYRQLVETMNEGLLMLDDQGRVQYSNPKISEILGYSRQEMKNVEYFKFIAEEEKAAAAFQWTLRMDGFQNSYETVLKRKSGEGLPVLVSPQRLADENDNFTGSLAVVTDISRNKDLEAAQQKKIKELASLRRIDTAILTGSTLKFVMQVILDQFRQELKADAVSIHIFHPGSKKVRLSRAFVGGNDFTCTSRDLNLSRIHDRRLELSGRLYNSGFNDVILWKELSGIDINLLYTAPIMAGENVKGLVEVAFTHPVEIDDGWESYFNALITQTAVGIEKTELFEKLQTRNSELQEAYVSTIKGWASALELRDEETMGHSGRVVQMTVDMTGKFGISGEALEQIRHGAFLHDIGKMGVPDGILLKPGKLTDEEWVIMKKHPEFAYNLLKDIPFLKDALEIPYYHHERWDGSGYPHGLRGQAIPLAARIFAVVDVWDALTSDRPYRPAWSTEKTIQYLQENRDILFDPQVVDLFLDMINARPGSEPAANE